MQISLNPKQFVPMWFLGEPKNIKLSLTMTEPGPVEINFFDLQIEDQKRILNDLFTGVLTSDVRFDELLKAFKDRQKQVEKVVEKPAPLQEKPVTETSAKPRKPYVRVEDQIDIKAKSLVKGSFPAIRSALHQDGTDIRLIRKVYEYEQQKKRPRKSVIDWLGEKLRKVEKDLAVKLESVSEKQKPKPSRDIADMYEVVDEDEEVVNFVIDNSTNNETIE